MEWFGADYCRRRHAYTRRPHLYRDGDTRSVCGRSHRLGMNTKVLEDASMWRLCAICEVIQRTHEVFEVEGEVASRTSLSEEPAALLLALSALVAVDFRVVRVIGRDEKDVRVIEVEDGSARAGDIHYLVSMVAHDAEGVRFVSKEDL